MSWYTVYLFCFSFWQCLLQTMLAGSQILRIELAITNTILLN